MRISDWSSDVCSSDLGPRERREIAGEGAHRLGARAVDAVHVEGQADDEADDGLRGDELAQRVEIGGEFPAEDRLVGGREAPPRVAQRDADGLGADGGPPEGSTEGRRVGKEGSWHGESMRS